MSYQDFKENVLSLVGSGLCEYVENVSLSDVSTFRIGGVCPLVVYPKSSFALRKIVECAEKTSVKYAVFGRCSNVLFSDDGYDGVLILTSRMKSISRKSSTITAECGVMLGELSKFAAFASLSGCEFMHGIPGTVGGAVFMNAGAYEHSVSEIIVSASYYSKEDNEMHRISREEMALSYRESIFAHHPEWIITEATFELKKGVMADIKAQMDDYMARRRAKQPVGFPSAGSVFRRPDGYFAGKLIEDCGLKGKMYGGALVSPKHAGFIVNNGGATASEVKWLIKHIQDTVMEKFGVEMKTEVIFFPDENEKSL